MSKVIAVIPARAGSKRVPGKNMALVGGKPLIQWSIDWALAQSGIDRVCVTTDCLDVLSLAARYREVVSILRPVRLAQDGTPDLPVFQHVIQTLDCDDSDIIAHVRPTTPFRSAYIFAESKACMDRTQATAARSVRKSASIPWKQYVGLPDGTLRPVATPEGMTDAINMPAQSLPPVYDHDGALDLVRVDTVKAGSMTGPRIAGVLNDYEFHVDIDWPEDLETARHYAARLNQEAETWRSRMVS